MIVRTGASTSTDARTAARELHAAIGAPKAALAVFYAAPTYDLDVLGAELARLFEGVHLIGCTTAGEITPLGYMNGALTGVSLESPDLVVESAVLDSLREFQFLRGEAVAKALADAVERRGIAPTASNTFGFLLIDGLCNQEEAVVASLARAIPNIGLIGGSAGDGTRFERTFTYHDGAFHQDHAVFTLVQTSHPFVVFKTQHFVSSTEKMVVTQADPARRIVTEINGEPAVREYARLVGLDVQKLTPLIFAAYPVVVKVGGAYYVRSIQKVNPDESLSFFCAIDEGIVLTVARGVDMVENLRSAFEEVRAKIGPPEVVLGCDCILRHLEVDQKGIREEISNIFVENHVIGFGTYGEQFNAMHVNQTFTGVAIGRGEGAGE